MNDDQTTELLPVVDSDQAPAVPSERPWYRRRTPIVIAVFAVAAVLATSGGIQIARANTASVVADLTTQINDKTAKYTSAWTDLVSAGRDGQGVYAESEGRVVEEETRSNLAEKLTPPGTPRGVLYVLSIDLIRTDGLGVRPPARLPADPSVDDARRVLEAIAADTRTMTEYTAMLTDATAAVRESMAAWDLAQAVAALDQTVTDLTGSIDNAGAVLAGSEGKVVDNGVRQVLADAITAATGVRDGAVDRTDLAAVQAATVTLGEHKAAVDQATQPVVDAQAAWQAAQDSQVTQPRQGGGTTPKNNTGGTGKSGGGTTPKSGGGTGTPPQNNTGGQGGGGYSTETTEEGFGSDLCGDESGNSWEC
jgi:hypothetical protein